MELIQCFDLPPVIKICRDIKAREVYYNLHFNLTDMEWRFCVCDKNDEELFQIKKDPFVHRDERPEDREYNVTNTRMVNGDKVLMRGFSNQGGMNGLRLVFDNGMEVAFEGGGFFREGSWKLKYADQVIGKISEPKKIRASDDYSFIYSSEIDRPTALFILTTFYAWHVSGPADVFSRINYEYRKIKRGDLNWKNRDKK